MTRAQAGERPSSPGASAGARDDEIVSARLVAWLDAVLAGRAPNAGRFCGNCYHPRQAEDGDCPHCGSSVAKGGSVDSVPLVVIEVLRRQRGSGAGGPWRGQGRPVTSSPAEHALPEPVKITTRTASSIWAWSNVSTRSRFISWVIPLSRSG